MQAFVPRPSLRSPPTAWVLPLLARVLLVSGIKDLQLLLSNATGGKPSSKAQPRSLKDAAVHTEGPKRSRDEKLTATILILGVFCEREKDNLSVFGHKFFRNVANSG